MMHPETISNLRIAIYGLVLGIVVYLLVGCSVPSRQTYEATHQLQLLSVRPGIIDQDIHGLEFQVFNSTNYLVDEISVCVLQRDGNQYFAVPIIIRPYLEPGQTGVFYLDYDLRRLGDILADPLSGELMMARRSWYAAQAWKDRRPILATATYRSWFEIVAYRHRGPASD